MISQRDFNDLINQVNKKFGQLDATIARLEKEIAALSTPKAKKTVDKSE